MSGDGASFLQGLLDAERALRRRGFSGRLAFAALARTLARRLELPPDLWPEGPDVPIRELDLPLTAEFDLFGLAYERFFPDLFRGRHGQYFTPRPLVELMLDLARVDQRDTVLDPTCGSGAFLVAAWLRGADVDGIEVDPDLAALARINLALHGGPVRAVRRADLFAAPPEGRWSVVLANPPFSLPLEVGEPREGGIAGHRRRIPTHEAILEIAWRLLRPGGRLCIIVPYSLVSNPTAAGVRTWLADRFERRAVIALPEGVFLPFGGTASRAAILLLQRRPAPAGEVILARVRVPGYDPGSRIYRPLERDDLARLRLHLVAGEPYPDVLREGPGAPWDPLERLGGETLLAAGVPRVPLARLVEARERLVRPARTPDDTFIEVDLADVDGRTGEVVDGRVRPGRAFGARQAKSAFEPGRILFSRLRPRRNKVAIARLPPGLPVPPDARLVGSSEWIPLAPRADPWFALLALRSPFVHRGLGATAGQTRPRIRADDLLALEVPDPGPPLRARLGALLREADRARREALARIRAIEALYRAFGEGRLDADALDRAIGELEGGPAGRAARPAPDEGD